MRKVTNSWNVFHRWANQSGPEGYNSGRTVSFQGDTAYSYNAAIGRIVRNHKGERACYLNNHRYSITTTRHQRYCLWAVPINVLVFPFDFTKGESTESIIAQFRETIAEEMRKGDRARLHKLSHYRRAANVYNNAIQFYRFWGIRGRIVSAKVKYKLLKSLEEAEATEAARLSEAEKVRLAEQEEDRKNLAKERDAWVQGLKSRPSIVWGHLFPTCLRIVGDTVETSNGAAVSLAAARRVWGVFKSGKPVHGETLGHYRVISFDGTSFRIGCHVIPLAEAERVLN